MNAYKRFDHISRSATIFRGMRAYSPWNHSTITNAILKATQRVKVAMTESSLHGFSRQPHCKPKVKQMTEVNSKVQPGRSICSKISLHVAEAGLICFGMRKNRDCRTRAVPLTRRFTQKHHRQVTSVVNTPPIRAPMVVAIMNTPIHRPMSKERVLGWAVKVIIRTEPPSVPAHPQPCRARPMINAMLLGAVAPTILPIRYKIRAVIYVH